jgi:hypothetical protein
LIRDVIAITDQTPIRTPRIVREERNLFDQREFRAMRIPSFISTIVILSLYS